jgi:RNA polymerase sigma-70 factor (sigma-E family)
MSFTEEEFNFFVEASSTKLLHLAFLLTRDREDAEDIVQVALLRTANRLWTAKSNPHAYARKVVVNLAKNRWRDKSRKIGVARELQEDDLVDQAEYSRLDERRTLPELLKRLPIGQREILVLRFFEDLSVRDVGKLLKCSEGNVKSQTSRALVTLREHLRKSENAESLEN